MWVTHRQLAAACAIAAAGAIASTLAIATVWDAILDDQDKPKYENSILGRDVDGRDRCMPDHFLMNIGAGILACVPFERPKK